MKTTKNLSIIVLCGICLFIIVVGFFLYAGNVSTMLLNKSVNSSVSDNDVVSITEITGPFHVNATIHPSSGYLSAYQGIFERNGSLNLQFHPIFGERQNVTTEQDAPTVAKKIMENYGGLPEDAVYDGANTTYSEIYNHTLHQTTYRKPMFVTVSYSQEVNKMPVFGDSNSIKLTLGTDGELLWIFKVWRNYTYAGKVSLISVDAAIDKLEHHDWVETTWTPVEGNVSIDSIGQGYYAQDINESAAKLEPIWVLSGQGATGNRIDFHIYARQFANFTASPTVAAPLEEIQFNDLSDASPIRWLWDFGDDTNSTLRNPVHAYQKPGIFKVTLTAWNDLGDDTLVKSDYIAIRPATTITVKSGNTSENL